MSRISRRVSRKWRRFKNRRLGEVPQKVSEYIPQPVSETGEKGWKAVDRGNKIRFAIFLAIMATIPTLISQFTGLGIHFGGTSLLIIIGVAIDTMKQLENQMVMRNYRGFLK